MADILDRIQKLMALASSSNENEARNAAFLAVKLIREHNVHLSLTKMHTPSPFEDLDTFWRGRSHSPRNPPPPDETRTDIYGRPWDFYQYSPFIDNCTYCGRVIRRTAPVMKRNGEGPEMQHERCWEASNPRQRKPNAKDFTISAEELDEMFK